MTHPCVQCGKELKEHYYDHGLYHLVCTDQSCPAYSFLQAGLEPKITHKPDGNGCDGCCAEMLQNACKAQYI